MALYQFTLVSLRRYEHCGIGCHHYQMGRCDPAGNGVRLEIKIATFFLSNERNDVWMGSFGPGRNGFAFYINYQLSNNQ